MTSATYTSIDGRCPTKLFLLAWAVSPGGLNQIEIWFGILHKRILKYGSFKTAQGLTDRVCGFVDHWNCYEARPFRWTFRGFRANGQLRRAA
jgi:hypothetical protein